MLLTKLKSLSWSRRARLLIAGIPIALGVSIYLSNSFDDFSLTDPQFVGVAITILVALLYCWGVFIYAVVVNRWLQRSWRWLFAPRVQPFDLRWLRWLVTLAAILCGLSIGYFLFAPWLLFPTVAALGTILCVYFGHLLLFRLQCSLLVLLSATIFYGLIDGLILSTPGALKLGLYFSPMIAAWVLYGMVCGLVQARLLGLSSDKSVLLHIAAAWLGNASLAMLSVGTAILFAASNPRMGMSSYAIYGVPLAVIGAVAFIVDVCYSAKMRKRAKTILALQR